LLCLFLFLFLHQTNDDEDSKLLLHNNKGKCGSNAQTKRCQQTTQTEETETLGPLTS
jgi:hypothetical protein